MKQLKILAVGDIVGPAAVECLSKNLWALRREYGADFVVTNGENAAVGNGLDIAGAKAILYAGTDVITSGNHIWQKNELRGMLDDSPQLLRPVNYPAICPGMGYTVRDADGWRILVINVQGTVFMEPLDNPFNAVEHVLEREKGRYDFAVMDVHAEATSEKLALAKYFDGKINIVFGTHTHVQTADAQVLPGGTGYITDLGMTGPRDSILGVKNEIIIERMRSKLPARFALSDSPITLCGACFTLDPSTGKCVNAEPVRRDF